MPIHSGLTSNRLACLLALPVSLALTIACSDSTSSPGEITVPETGAKQDMTPPFVDATVSSKLDFVHSPYLTGRYYMPEIMGAGIGLIDYDQDGDLDLYLLQGAPWNEVDGPKAMDQLFKNMYVETGALEFLNVTADSRIEATGYGMGVAVGDYDGDGFDDLFVTNLGSNQLWRNHGDGHFEEVSDRAGIVGKDWSSSAAFVDVDNDHDLDLYVVNYVVFSSEQNFQCTSESGKQDYCGPDTYKPVRDQLFINDGNGQFKESGAQFGMGKAYGPGLGVAVSDFDGNGYADIYVANDGAANQLWMNNGTGQFLDNGLMSGTSLNGAGAAEAGMGVMAGDFDNDGDDDLFMTHLIAETNTLYMNTGSGQFFDATNQVNLAAESLPMTGFGAGWLDYNNDTYLDLFVANGNVKLEPGRASKSAYPFEQANQLFKNTYAQSGRFEFVDVSHQAPDVFAKLEVSRGAAFGDLDNNGAVDIVVTNNNGPARVLVNTRQSGHWYGIKLLDPDNKGTDGALVTLQSESRVLDRGRVRRSGSYLSSHDDRLRLFDPAGGAGSYEIVVEWPDGLVETWLDLDAGRYHEFMRGQGLAQPVTELTHD